MELVDRPGPVTALTIALGDEFLIGLSMINYFSVTFDHGQRLIVKP